MHTQNPNSMQLLLHLLLIETVLVYSYISRALLNFFFLILRVTALTNSCQTWAYPRLLLQCGVVMRCEWVCVCMCVLKSC